MHYNPHDPLADWHSWCSVYKGRFIKFMFRLNLMGPNTFYYLWHKWK